MRRHSLRAAAPAAHVNRLGCGASGVDIMTENRDPRIKACLNGWDADVIWGQDHENSLILVKEVLRRFMEEIGDTRAASALTLAWAMLEAGSRASSQ